MNNSASSACGDSFEGTSSYITMDNLSRHPIQSHNSKFRKRPSSEQIERPGECCFRTVKYSIFAFNLIFWLLGGLILGLGIFIRTYRAYPDIPGNKVPFLHTGSYILIVSGLIALSTGFLGCCGAIRESRCMLLVFFAILWLTFILLLGAGLWAVINKPQLEDDLSNYMKNGFMKDPNNQKSLLVSDSTKFLNLLENGLNCCGINGEQDYNTIGIPAPEICKQGKTNARKKGCFGKFMEYVHENLFLTATVGMGTSLIMIFGMVFSIMLCCFIQEYQ